MGIIELLLMKIWHMHIRMEQNTVLEKNGNGWSNGPWKYANIWSDLEVRHKGSTVKYYHVWN